MLPADHEAEPTARRYEGRRSCFAPNARYASIRFVTGHAGSAAGSLVIPREKPPSAIYGAETPGRFKAEIKALEAVPNNAELVPRLQTGKLAQEE